MEKHKTYQNGECANNAWEGGIGKRYKVGGMIEISMVCSIERKAFPKRNTPDGHGIWRGGDSDGIPPCIAVYQFLFVTR
jgi:hypothetical protein